MTIMFYHRRWESSGVAESEIVELTKRIDGSRGYALYDEISHLQRSFDILSQNYAELETILKNLSQEKAALALYKGPRAKTNFLWLQIHRVLQNYLAAVNALMDHLNRFMQKEKHVEFKSEYETRFKVIRKSTTGMFVKDLRDYFLHYDVGPVCVVVTWEGVDGPSKASIDFDCQGLLKWQGWTSPSRTYLKELRDIRKPLVILDLLGKYQQSIKELDAWILPELQRVYQQELKEYSDAAKEFARLNREVMAQAEKQLMNGIRPP